MKRFLLLAVIAAAAISAPVLAQKPQPTRTPPVPAAADFRTVSPDNLLVVDTTKGRILVELVPEVAPQAVARIKELAREHFYDGLTWHRVVAGFMAQGGDPKGDGSGGSSKPNVPGEFIFRRGPETPFTRVSALAGIEDGFVRSMPVRSQNSGLMLMTADGRVQSWAVWCPGVAGMARAGPPDSANSQFFLMSAFNEGLEKQYTAFGAVLSGQATVRALKVGEPVESPDKMVQVRLASDMPVAGRPTAQVLDTESAYFKGLVAAAPSVCDIALSVKVGP